jgi:hypothetical protein
MPGLSAYPRHERGGRAHLRAVYDAVGASLDAPSSRYVPMCHGASWGNESFAGLGRGGRPDSTGERLGIFLLSGCLDQDALLGCLALRREGTGMSVITLLVVILLVILVVYATQQLADPTLRNILYVVLVIILVLLLVQGFGIDYRFSGRVDR